jgi:hypothetical protein
MACHDVPQTAPLRLRVDGDDLSSRVTLDLARGHGESCTCSRCWWFARSFV